MSKDSKRSLIIWESQRQKVGYIKQSPDQNYLTRFRIRQEEILENDITKRFIRDKIHEYRKLYYPIIEVCRNKGKIKYIEKGKYSYKFKQIHPRARLLATNRVGIDIEEWCEVHQYSVKEVFDFLKKFDSDDYYGF